MSHPRQTPLDRQAPLVDRHGREVGWRDAVAAGRVDDDEALGHAVARAEPHRALQVGAARLGECPERVQVGVGAG